MNTIDIIILLFLASGAIIGYNRGLINAVISLISVFLSIWIGFKFHHFLEGFVVNSKAVSPEWVSVVSIGLTIVLSYFLIKIFGKILSSFTKTIGLDLLNRLAGAIFGFAINLLILGALTAYSVPFLKLSEEENIFSQSLFLPYLTEVSNLIKDNTGGLKEEVMKQI